MDNGRIVLPRSRRQLEDIAANVRATLGLSAGGRVSMQPLLEETLYDVLDDYGFQVRRDKEMGQMDGLTDDQKPIIYLKESVYHRLERGEGGARMIAAHEFGHLVLHCGMPTFRAFSEEYQPLYDPERQANIFAASFLMPEQAFRECMSAREAMTRFGVSQDAAMYRARILKHKLKQTRAILTIKKKGTGKRQSP